jgi:hypothetical protein
MWLWYQRVNAIALIVGNVLKFENKLCCKMPSVTFFHNSNEAIKSELNRKKNVRERIMITDFLHDAQQWRSSIRNSGFQEFETFCLKTVHRSTILRGSIHCKVESPQGRFIVVKSSWVDLSQGQSQGRFIAGSIHRRVDSSQGRFIAAELCLLKTLQNSTKLDSFYCKNFFVAARRYWKASFTEFYLIEMYDFWFEHENWVHLVVKSFSSPTGTTEKLVLQKSTWLKM